MKKVSATAPTIEGKQYHIHCGAGDVAETVLMPGDPARVSIFARGWDSAKEIANHREYHTMTGSIDGIAISSVSSGIGSPSTAIAADELFRIGVRTIIRVGSTGALQQDMNLGDLVISTGAVRLDGTSRDFVIPEYPAVADYEVVMALIQAAEEATIPYHVGITASTDTFYTGQGRPTINNYLPSFKRTILEDMQRANVKNFEMETATLLTMANLFQKRAGAICFVVANRVTDEFSITQDMAAKAGQVAARAAVLLHTWDTVKKGKKYLYPKLFR